MEDGGSPEQGKEGGHDENPHENDDGGDETPKDNGVNPHESSSEKEDKADTNPEEK